MYVVYEVHVVFEVYVHVIYVWVVYEVYVVPEVYVYVVCTCVWCVCVCECMRLCTCTEARGRYQKFYSITLHLTPLKQGFSRNMHLGQMMEGPRNPPKFLLQPQD